MSPKQRMSKGGVVVLLLVVILSACKYSSTPADLQPIINGQFKEAKAVFYPSTDDKVCAIVIDKDGTVHYLRLNGFGQLRDKMVLFNVKEYK